MATGRCCNRTAVTDAPRAAGEWSLVRNQCSGGQYVDHGAYRCGTFSCSMPTSLADRSGSPSGNKIRGSIQPARERSDVLKVPVVDHQNARAENQENGRFPASASAGEGACRSRSAFTTTDTENRLVANAAIIGLSTQPNTGNSSPAAIGTPTAL